MLNKDFGNFSSKDTKILLVACVYIRFSFSLDQQMKAQKQSTEI